VQALLASCRAAHARGWARRGALLTTLAPYAPRTSTLIAGLLAELAAAEASDAAGNKTSRAAGNKTSRASLGLGSADGGAPPALLAELFDPPALWSAEEMGGAASAALGVEAWSCADTLVSGARTHPGLVAALASVGGVAADADPAHVSKYCVDENVSSLLERAAAMLLRPMRGASDAASAEAGGRGGGGGGARGSHAKTAAARSAAMATAAQPLWIDRQSAREDASLEASTASTHSPVLRLLALGGDAVVHRLVCSYAKLLATVSVLLFTVTFHANPAHNLTRSP
jgi:hypothetical protein